MLMIKCCGGKIDGIFAFGAGGRVLYGAERLSYGMDAAVCAAGPAASAAAALLGQAAGLFDFACASMGLCVLNLLPAYPLDGGRLLECILPFEQARKTITVTSLICAFSLCAAGAFLALKNSNYSLLAVGATIFICHIGKKGIK
ncbi:MAG: hypothetical protein IJS65_08690 [Clostridia bacterium]|nr:hypothetical protein [Clostridia bacterium]